MCHLPRDAGLPGAPRDLLSHCNWRESPAVAQFYHIEWAFIPNLAGEVLVPLLAKLMALEAATKLFIMAGIVMWVVGPAMIHRALYGRIGAAPLIAAIFAYNANLMWGFLNYYFAMGLGFVIFAAWIAMEEDRRTPMRLAGFAVAVTILYFCHLFACATLALMMGSYEFGAWSLPPRPPLREMWRRLGAAAMVFVPAALALLFLKPRNPDADSDVAFDFMDTWLDRATAALQHHHDDPAFTIPVVLVVLLVAALLAGWAKVHRRMVLPLGVVGIAAVLAPEWAMGGWGVHLRLPAVFAALVFAAVDIRAGKFAIAAGAAALALISYNAAALTSNWHDYDRQFQEFRNVAHTLPPGLKLLTVLDGDAIGMRSDQPYWHITEFAIIDPGAMTQLMFTTPDQHVVLLNDAVPAFAAASAEEGSPPDIDELDDLTAGRIDADEDIENVFPYLMRYQCRYDKAVVIHLNGPRTRIPAPLHLYRAAVSSRSTTSIRPPAAPGHDSSRSHRAGRMRAARSWLRRRASRVIASLGLQIPLDPNEGWNAYHAQAAMTGGWLYAGPNSFIFDNYPPLSFYLVGVFGKLVGDNVIAGRFVSLLALATVGAGVFASLRLMKVGHGTPFSPYLRSSQGCLSSPIMWG